MIADASHQPKENTMKLNEKALEAAAQAHWEGLTVIEGSYRENAANPDALVSAVANCVTTYLDALDSEGLADLYEYWCERIEALPEATEVYKGDVYALSSDPQNEGQWAAFTSSINHSDLSSGYRVLRRTYRPRQWKIGDLVDDTRDLPEGAVVRDRAGDVAEHDGSGNFRIAGVAGALDFDYLLNPRIIWLPETKEDAS